MLHINVIVQVTNWAWDKVMHTMKQRTLLQLGALMMGVMLTACLSSRAATDQRIDINSATSQQLAQLPKITAVQVQAIIAGRPWNFIEDLVKKQILTQSEFDAIKLMIVAFQYSPIEGKGEKKKIH